MQMRSLIGRLQSPNFRVVAEIARTRSGAVLTRHRTVRFPPAGSVQLWAFGPYRDPREPDAQRAAESVVAVLFRNRTIESWKTLDMDFDQAVAHYRRQASLRQPVPAAPTRSLPELPPGVRAVIPEIGASRWRTTAGGESCD